MWYGRLHFMGETCDGTKSTTPMTTRATASNLFDFPLTTPKWGTPVCMRCRQPMPKGDLALFCPACLGIAPRSAEKEEHSAQTTA